MAKLHAPFIISVLLIFRKLETTSSFQYVGLNDFPVSTIGRGQARERNSRARSILRVLPDSDDDINTNGLGVDRRKILFWPIGFGGAVVYGKLVADAISKLSRGELAYPKAHEIRVEEVITKTLLASIPSGAATKRLRVLEVGIGKDCRLIRRGLYDRAFEELSPRGITEIELVGVDIAAPSREVLDASTQVLKEVAARNRIETDLKVVQQSITSPLGFNAGSFDAVICALTLCSIDDQDAALNEIKRLVRQNGGTFGYIEHVAVNSDEPYHLLSLQQELFDPLQQAVAENCHLHRFTDSNIARTFGTDDGNSPGVIPLFIERYLVDGMWPVSCQACGVIQRITS